ncbi:MAG TPA: threonyl-tRNA synthetase editing domain-containing protein [Candidatus Binatia bacterium]
MKLLCFQAKRFRWKTHSKTLPEAPAQEVDQTVEATLVVFLHAEARDADEERKTSIQRQTLKHIKWLANKRELNNIVLHSFAHLGGETALPAYAEAFITTLAERLRETGYKVWITPFGYFCEWDLSVYGESLAKVWKEIR